MTHVFNQILDCYTYEGLALMAVVVALFFVQLYYYAIAYYRVYNFPDSQYILFPYRSLRRVVYVI